MCLQPCSPPPTSTRFSDEQLEKEKLPVKVKHRHAEGIFFFFFFLLCYFGEEKLHLLDPGIKQMDLSSLSEKLLPKETTKDQR